MSSKTEYLKSIAESDLQKFIIEHLEDDPDVLLEKCIQFIRESRRDA